MPGETRDSVTDATEIAIWCGELDGDGADGASVGPSLFGWLAVYPRGQVS